MKSTYFYAIIFTTLIISGSCKKVLLGNPEENTILNNYDVFGKDFQEKYGLFKVRNIDWQQTLMTYRAQLEASPTEIKLQEVLEALIVELDDSHVSLGHPTHKFPTFDGGIWGELDRSGYQDMDFNLIKNNYLTVIDSSRGNFYYGTVDTNIAYLHLPWMKDDPDFFNSIMPKLISDIANTKGLIIDIRNNDGGEDESSRLIASFFADQKHHYMISRYKSGPGPDDFEAPINWYVEPANTKYLKPIIVLTNKYTISAAETFLLAMKTLPNVKHIGDTTCGAFSDVIDRELPNTWYYTISIGDYRDHNNISHEGVGLIPEFFIKNSSADLANGIDIVLEKAILELK